MKEEKKQPLTLPPTSPHLKKIFFPVPKKRSPFLKKREGASQSVDEESRKKSPAGETPVCRRRRRCLFSSTSLKGEARPGSAGNAALAAAANAATDAAARAPSRRVHGVSPGGCSGSPGTAPSSARPPASLSSRSSPSAAGPLPRRRRRPPQPSPAPARARRAHAHRPPRASLGARSRPRGPGRLDHVAGRAPSAPAPSPVVECVESTRLGAGRAREPRACALGRPGLRTGGGGEPGAGREGGLGAWRGQLAWGLLGPARVGARGCGSRGMFPPVSLGTPCGPLSPVYPARSSGHLSLDPLPQARGRRSGGLLQRPPGCFPRAT